MLRVLSGGASVFVMLIACASAAGAEPVSASAAASSKGVAATQTKRGNGSGANTDQQSGTSGDRVRYGSSSRFEYLFPDRGNWSSFPVAVDDCLADAAEANGPTPFACTMKSARAAAEAYRKKAEARQDDSDGLAAVSGVGLTGAVIGGAKAAASTTSAWTALGITPVVGEDLAAAGPRGRLYGIASIAMTRIIWRYMALEWALNAMGGQASALKADVKRACDEGSELFRLKKALASTSEGKLAVADAVKQAESRCASMTEAADQLATADRVWSGRAGYLAISAAKDVVEFDDTVARLDRGLRSSPSDAFRAVLSAPFSLVASAIRGGQGESTFTSRSLAAFNTPIVFDLTRLPKFALPAKLPDDLGRSTAVDEWIKGIKDAKGRKAAEALRTEMLTSNQIINGVAANINATTLYATEVDRFNDLSVLTINFAVLDRPVKLESPPRT